MQRVSVKTLALLLFALVAVVTHQHMRYVPAANASVLWLADDPNDPNDPSERGPESCLMGTQWTWLNATLQDPNEPNEPTEPVPEAVGRVSSVSSPADDPNDPSEPEPERA